MRASDVPAGAQLRQRHKNNPNGKWQPLSSLAERLPQRAVEVFRVVEIPHYMPGVPSTLLEVWERVEFPRGGNRVTDPEQQARAGKASGKARREKGKQKGKKKLNAKG